MTTVDVVTVENRKLFAVEIAIILALFVADMFGYVPIGKTLWLFVLGWVSLRLRRFGWRDVGLAAPTSWGKAIAIGIAAGAVISVMEFFMKPEAAPPAAGAETTLSDVGGLAATVTGLYLIAAVGEELVYRGYLLTRFGRMLGGTGTAWIVGLIVVTALYAFGSAEHGAAGVIQSVVIGVLLGVAYLATGRNLAAPILARVVVALTDLTLIFLGKYPGT
jgi:uncharacterized protein